MTENVAILLAVLVAANILLIIVALGRAWMQRRRASRYEETARSLQIADAADVSAAPRSYAPAVPVFEPLPTSSRTDPLTGALLPGEWNRILADEDARIHRYGRPATVVLVELDGLDRLVGVLGQEAGDRILPAVADALSRHARGADHIARLGPGRFGILLPETGEVEAVNYVERVRQVCELWLESGAIALRLAIGWASPAADTSLSDAFNEAQERMFAELRRSARRESDVEPNGPPPAAGLEGAPSPA
jgi:diguanylate cyclase (GGDEF)-like protein